MRQLNQDELGNVDGGITLGALANGGLTSSPLAVTTGAPPTPFPGGGVDFFPPPHGFGPFGGLLHDPGTRAAIGQFLDDPAFENALNQFTAANPQLADQITNALERFEERLENGFQFGPPGANGTFPGFPNPQGIAPFTGLPVGPGTFTFNGQGAIPPLFTPPGFNGFPTGGVPAGLPPGTTGNGTLTLGPNSQSYSYSYSYSSPPQA